MEPVTKHNEKKQKKQQSKEKEKCNFQWEDLSLCFIFLNHFSLFAFDAFYAGISYPRFQLPSFRPLLKGHLLSEGFADQSLLKIVMALLLSTTEI